MGYKKAGILSALIFSVLMLQPFAYSEEMAPLSQGVADYKDESYEEALINLTEARKDDPQSARAAYYLGLTYKMLQDFKNAKEQLKDALTLDPSLYEAHLDLAEALYNLGDVNETLRELDEAQKNGVRPGEVYFMRGLAFLKQGRNSDAIDEFRKAKAADKSLSQAADYQIGLAYINENKLSEERAVFNEVIIRDPNTDLAQFADEYSKTIEKKLETEKPFKLTMGLRYEYDDNVILKPADTAVATGITGEIDRREVFTLRGEYDKKFNSTWSVKTQYSLYLSNQRHLKSHNIQSHTASVIPSYNFRNSTASAFLSYNNTPVHGRGYLQSLALTPAYNFMLGASNVGAVSLRVQKTCREVRS